LAGLVGALVAASAVARAQGTTPPEPAPAGAPTQAPAQPLEPLPPPTPAPPTVSPPPASTPPPTGAPPWTPPPPLGPDTAQWGSTVPAETAAPPASGTAPEPARPPKKYRPTGKAELGYQYAQVHGVPINAGRLNLGFGAQTDEMANYATLSIMVGETAAHRRAWDLRVGWTGDLYREGILRLGLAGRAGYLVIRRITTDSRAYAFGIGAGVHAGVDLVPFGDRGDHALTLDAHFDADIHFGNAFQWGPSVLLGFRY
jgi:hypothetical protein